MTTLLQKDRMQKDRTAVRRMAKYRSRQIGEKGLRRIEFQVPHDAVPAVRALVHDWLLKHKQPAELESTATAPSPSKINPETVNDVAKLIIHRRIARKLRSNPELIDAARRVVESWPPDVGRQTAEWRQVLRKPAEEIAQILVAPGDRSRRLRNSSPFSVLDGVAISNPNARKRLWRSVKRMLERRKTTSEPLGR